MRLYIFLFFLLSPEMANPTTSATTANNSKSLNIYYGNAESLRHKLDLLLYDAMDCEIICLTETWLDPTLPDSTLKLRGYQTIERHDRKPPDLGNINHGGVAVYVCENLGCKRRYDLEVPGIESIWTEIFSQHGNFLLSCIYRPPSENVNYWKLLERHIESARDTSPLPVYICGDFNNNTHSPNNNIVPLLNRQGFAVLNDEPTFYTQTSANCLDIFASTKPNDVNEVITCSPSLSGHSSLIMKKHLKLPKPKSYTRKILNYKKTNWTGVNTQLADVVWPEITDETNLDDYVTMWTNKFTVCLENNTLVKTIRIRPGDKSWMSSDIKKLMEKRNSAYRKAKGKPKSHPDWCRHRELCLLKRVAIDRAKQARLDKLANRINGGPQGEKEWWEISKRNVLSPKRYYRGTA